LNQDFDDKQNLIHIFKETNTGNFEFLDQVKNPRGFDAKRIRIDDSDNLYVIASDSVYVYSIKYWSKLPSFSIFIKTL